MCSFSTLETLYPSVGVGLGGDAWVTPLTWSQSLVAGGKECQRPQVVWSMCWHLETWQVHSLKFGGSLFCGGWSVPGHPWQRWTSIPGRNSPLGSAQHCLNTTLKKNCCDATVMLTKGSVFVLLPLQWQLYCASQSCGYDPRWLQWGMVAARRRRSQ